MDGCILVVYLFMIYLLSIIYYLLFRSGGVAYNRIVSTGTGIGPSIFLAMPCYSEYSILTQTSRMKYIHTWIDSPLDNELGVLREEVNRWVVWFMSILSCQYHTAGNR